MFWADADYDAYADAYRRGRRPCWRWSFRLSRWSRMLPPEKDTEKWMPNERGRDRSAVFMAVYGALIDDPR